MAFTELKRIHGFFTFSADPAAIIRDDGRLVRINPAFRKKIHDFGPAYRGKIIWDHFFGEYKKDFTIQLKRARHEKKSFYFDVHVDTPTAGERWFQWNIIPHGRRKKFYASGRDISLFKQQEEQLRVSYTAMEAAANGIYLLDKDKKIFWANLSFSKISGYDRKDIEGKTPKIFGSGAQSEDFYMSMMNTLSSGMVWVGEIVNRRPDGVLYTVEQTIAPVYNPNGALSHFVAIMQDISERKKSEKLLMSHLQLLEREIELAGKVQKSLLPDSLPELDGFRIAARAIPAQFVSGDLYSCFRQDDNGCFFTMADISGKGVPAAMLASSLKTLIQTHRNDTERPSLFLREINNNLYGQLSHAEKIITLCAVQFNPEISCIRYASAGHTQAIIVRAHENSIELLPSTGIPLGILEETEYTEIEKHLAPGDSFILYSDGITEAHNEESQLFGMDRLIETLKACPVTTAENRLDSIIDAVNEFRGDAPLFDDLSLVTLIAEPRKIRNSWKADIANLEAMNSVVRNSSSAYGGDFSYAVELCASELFTNIIKHSHGNHEGNVTLALSLEQDRIELDVYDTAPLFTGDIQPKTNSDLLKEGGHGLTIIHQLSDEFTHIGLEPHGNHWHVVKRREDGGTFTS